MTERVVVLIDMDCFYCQVETRAHPEWVGQPLAVVQYNSWKGGGIIAVNYEARAHGVTRQMRGDEARAKCPDIVLVSVPEVRQKADLTKYREAGQEVIQVLLQFGAVVERASIDEAYLDVTALVEAKLQVTPCVSPSDLPHSFVVGSEGSEREVGVTEWLARTYEHPERDNMRLALGGVVVEAMRQAVWDTTQFRCSAGVAHNKMLSKLACGLNKPNAQTLLPHERVGGLFADLKLTKLRGLGGKLGLAIRERLQCETVADVAGKSVSELRRHFDEKTAQWLYQISRGLEDEPVKERDLPKSIGCSKNFLGPKMLDTREQVEFWFGSLAEELCERLERDRETNGRLARGLTVSISLEGQGQVSRAGALSGYEPQKLTRQALALIGKLNEAARSSEHPDRWQPKLKNLSLSASKFEEDSMSGATQSIGNFFAKSNAISSNPDTSQGDAKAQELVPNLDEYDPSILELLPVKLKGAVLKRVQTLQSESPESREDDLAPVEEEELAPVAEDAGAGPSRDPDLEQCLKCTRMISPFELPEHLDFHLAQELQADMTKDRPKAQVHTVDMSHKAKPKKRKPNSAAPDSAESKRQRNILSFFTKSST